MAATPPMIAALFVEQDGVYTYNNPGIDPWPAWRDARNYTGPHPVIVHPPCQRWSVLAHSVKARYGIPIKEDGGLFAFALETVEKYGGVLEHPANSMAWEQFDLARPYRGKWLATRKGWTCEVAQSAYGHVAQKLTWLYCVSQAKPFDLDWSRPRGIKQITQDSRVTGRLPTATKSEHNATPVEFRRVLERLARLSCK